MSNSNSESLPVETDEENTDRIVALEKSLNRLCDRLNTPILNILLVTAVVRIVMYFTGYV